MVVRSAGLVKRWSSGWRSLATIAAAALLAAAGFTGAWCAAADLSSRLEVIPFSPVFTDRDGGELLVRPASDAQVRLPYAPGAHGPWIEAATIAVEDVRFDRHPGVDLRAIARAAVTNARSRRAAEGASTIAMQVAKMLEPRPRTLAVKASEALRALKLVRRAGREDVLRAYLVLAPYGGNLSGAEAAARHYFGRPLRDCTLAEAALLAGLPQSPERLRPDRFPSAALSRRNIVLDRMLSAGAIDIDTHARAVAEPIVLAARPRTIPARAAVLFAESLDPGGGRLTIDPQMQRMVEELARTHARAIGGGVECAVAVIDIDAAAWRALAVSTDPDDPVNGWLPLFAAWRSPGSALKPFIYAAAFERERLDPDALVPDRIRAFGGWRPRNIDRTEAQWTTAREALSRSLNLPAIAILREIGTAPVRETLEDCGVRFRPGDVERAGLGLAVGAAEARLIDLTVASATLAREGVYRPTTLFDHAGAGPDGAAHPALTARTAAAVNAILSIRHRAPDALAHLLPEDRPWMTWKTGTSSAHRDAWSIGHNHRYAVGVWVGRPGGGGMPGLQGAPAAEPLMVELLAHPRLGPSRPPDLEGHAAPSSWSARNPVSWRDPIDALPGTAGGDSMPDALRGPVIESPQSDVVYLPLGGLARIHLRATEPVRWFLNAEPLCIETGYVDLPSGVYEFLAMTPRGDTRRMRVAVGGRDTDR